MQRKEFIKSSVLAVASLNSLSQISCKKEAKVIRKNWAKNYEYAAQDLITPTSSEDLVQLISKQNQHKALGSCHCFNDIADTAGSQISTQKLNKVLDWGSDFVTVQAGIKYGELAPQMQSRGLALHNLASLPHISVGGAIATGTHGSGVGNGNLSTAVQGLKIITPQGDIVNLSPEKDGEIFNAAVVSLGALGLVAEVTLAAQPSFEVRQDLFQDLPLSSLVDHFDQIMSAGYSVSLFTDWLNKNISQVWVKSRVGAGFKKFGSEFYGAKAAIKNLHPITSLSAENCTEQLGVPGLWYERLPHFKMGFTPSSGDELQAEYFVEKTNAVEAILALEKMGEEINSHLLITEIRTIAADELWLSPAYKRDSVAIHFTLKPDTGAQQKLLPKIEAALAPFDVRPHWGKLFTINRDTLMKRYPRMQDFIDLAKNYDPKAKLINNYLERNLYGK